MLLVVGCSDEVVFQADVPVPGGAWTRSFTPEFAFDIADTLAQHDVYIDVRHTGDYPFSNLFLFVDLSGPGGRTARMPVGSVSGSRTTGEPGTTNVDPTNGTTSTTGEPPPPPPPPPPPALDPSIPQPRDDVPRPEGAAVNGVGSGANPAGRVHLASAMRGGEVLHAQRDFGSSGRDAVRRATVLAALDLLLARLSGG